MNAKMLKKLRNTIISFDSGIYIENVKKSLYYISKIMYVFTFHNSDNFDVFAEKISNDMKLLDEKNVLLFNEYSEFNIANKDHETLIIQFLYEERENFDFQFLKFSELYESLLSSNERKILGQVYTPVPIVDLMIENLFSNSLIDRNFKIIDPACGGGYFLLKLYEKLKNFFYANSISINDSVDSVERYILENMIYGCDIDRFSVFLSKISLIFASNINDIELNIFNENFLTDFEVAYKFDVIIGNPPYIGHKNIPKSDTQALKQRYDQVFYDKADISYCFFERGLELLKEEGTINFITSRYFLEAKNGDKLRIFLKENFEIQKLVDFNGKRVFKQAIVSPAIVFLKKKINLKNLTKVEKYDGNARKFVNFIVKQCELNENGWILLDESEKIRYKNIELKCNTLLKNIATIKQGIITGYDKAFIVTEDVIIKYNLERDLIKKWIKNSNIKKSGIIYEGLYIIYSNLIDKEENYPNTISYLNQFKEKLMTRRECKSGIRKWYELQWGRSLADFENRKILFPYKSAGNNFSLDDIGYLCSADVYILHANENKVISEYLVKFLNSSFFEFYFKRRTKVVGENLFEYYPNKLETSMVYIPKFHEMQNLIGVDELTFEKYLHDIFNE